MKVLIACEESQEVCKAFRKFGHEAFSCDIQECSGGHPEWHIQGDVLEQLNKGWDLMIAHPPCTHLAVSGAKWFKYKKKEQKESLEFVRKLLNAPIKHIALENPVGIISTKIKKPDQIIQPYMFGDKARKTTCLWLKNLPKLKSTKLVEPELYTDKRGRTYSKDFLFDKEGKWTRWRGQGKRRSKTYPGIAKAMAKQWGIFT